MVLGRMVSLKLIMERIALGLVASTLQKVICELSSYLST